MNENVVAALFQFDETKAFDPVIPRDRAEALFLPSLLWCRIRSNGVFLPARYRHYLAHLRFSLGTFFNQDLKLGALRETCLTYCLQLGNVEEGI